MGGLKVAQIYIDSLEALDFLHRQRHLLRGLDNVCIATGDRVGQEPERDHAGEVERGNDYIVKVKSRTSIPGIKQPPS